MMLTDRASSRLSIRYERVRVYVSYSYPTQSGASVDSLASLYYTVLFSISMYNNTHNAFAQIRHTHVW